MKKTIISLLILFACGNISAKEESITNLTAGTLASQFLAGEPAGITSLTISGEMDARDFRFLRDSMIAIELLDLEDVSIVAYTGPGGTAMTSKNGDFIEDENAVYNADEFPTNYFLQVSDDRPDFTLIFPISVKSIALSGFNGGQSLSQIVFPANCKLETIGDQAFRYSGLKSIYLPKTVKEIGRNMFFQCPDLERADLSDLEMDIIPRLIFADCYSLSYAIFSEHVDSIEQLAFQVVPIRDYAMDTIVMQSVNPPKLGPNAFQYSDTYGKPHLIVPDGSRQAYKDAGYEEWFVIDDTISVTGIMLSLTERQLSVDSSFTLYHVVLPTNATNQTVIWHNSDETIVQMELLEYAPSVSDYIYAKITGLKAGTATITATTEDGNFSAQCEITVIEGPIRVTSITINKTELETTEMDFERLSAYITPSYAANTNVIWSSNDTNIIKISPRSNTSAEFYAKGEGTFIITATTEDGGFTAQCEVKVNKRIYPVTGISLNKTAVTIYPDGTQQLAATVYPYYATNPNFAWSNLYDSIATVDENGLVTPIKAGTTTITVTTEDGNHTATCIVTVQEGVSVTEVKVLPERVTININDTLPLSIEILPNNATRKDIIWKSSDYNVVNFPYNFSVAGKIHIIGLKEGTATITVESFNGGHIGTCEVTVQGDPIAVDGIELDNDSIDVFVGDTLQLLATVFPSNAKNKNIQWQSSNEDIATVDENGLVTAVAEGSTVITVTAEDGGAAATCEVTVSKAIVPVTGITLTPQNLTMEIGVQEQLTATIEPTNATNQNLFWQSDNAGIATVDENGVVTSVSEGIARITVTTEDGEFTATCLVTVTSDVSILNVDDIKINIYPNPTTGIINIISNDGAIKDISVYTINGVLVKTSGTFSQTNKTTSVNIADLPNGIYLLKIGTDKGSLVREVIKE